MSLYNQSTEFNSQIQNQWDSEEDTFANLEQEAINEYRPTAFSRHDMIFNNVIGYHYGPSPFSIFQRYHSCSRGELALEYPNKSESRNFYRGLLQGSRIKPKYSAWTLHQNHNQYQLPVDVQEEIANMKMGPTYTTTTTTKPKSRSRKIVRYENPIVKQFREAIWNLNRTSSKENCDNSTHLDLDENNEENNMVVELLSPRNIDDQNSDDEADFSIFLCKKGKGLGRKEFSSSNVVKNQGIHNFKIIM